MLDPFFLFVSISTVFLVALSKSGLLGILGIVGVPLLSLIMAPREAAGVLLPILIVMDVIGLIVYRREVDWDNLKILLPGGLAGLAIGWALSSVVSDDAVLLALGLIIFVFVLNIILPKAKPVGAKAPSKPWGLFWGAISGFTSFVSHSGGPPFQVYLLPQKLAPAVFAGTTVFFFSTLNAVKLVPYYFLGQISITSMKLSLALLPVAVFGMAVGIFLVRRISVHLFYNITYVLVFLLSIKLIYDGGRGVFGL